MMLTEGSTSEMWSRVAKQGIGARDCAAAITGMRGGGVVGYTGIKMRGVVGPTQGQVWSRQLPKDVTKVKSPGVPVREKLVGKADVVRETEFYANRFRLPDLLYISWMHSSSV